MGSVNKFCERCKPFEVHEVQVGCGPRKETEMMFNGTTIDELMGMVQKCEARAESVKMERNLMLSAPAYACGVQQFQKFEREMALVGVA